MDLQKVQDHDRRDFTRNTGKTPLSSDSGRLDLRTERDKIDESRDIDYSEDGDIPATRPKFDWRAHASHRNTFDSVLKTRICEQQKLSRNAVIFSTKR